MDRVHRVVAIIHVCLGVLGVAGGCVELHAVLQESARMAKAFETGPAAFPGELEEMRRGIREDTLRFTVAECAWIAASAFLVVGGVGALRGARRTHMVLILSLVIIPAVCVVSGLLRHRHFSPPWNESVYQIVSVAGLGGLPGVRIAIWVFGAASVVAYPLLAFVLLRRSNRRKVPGVADGAGGPHDSAKAGGSDIETDRGRA